MKKYYDKILFLLGLAVVGIGFGIFSYKGGVPQPVSMPDIKLTGNAFEPIPPPKIAEPSVIWEAPPNQREDYDEPGWVYSIFTPPKIYWQDGEGWVVHDSGVMAPQPFGVHLVAAKKDLYRIQMLGVAGKSEADPTDLIRFSDEETGAPLELRLGEESTRSQIKVTDLKIDRVDKGHGLIKNIATVTILDERTGQSVVLTQDEPYSPTNNEYYILQVSDPYPPEEWHVTAKGDKKDLPGKASFVVTDLDFDKPSVTVEKHSISRSGKELVSKPHVLTLEDDTATPSQPATPTPAAKPAKGKAPASTTTPVTTSDK